jgi:hypothetical protein
MVGIPQLLSPGAKVPRGLIGPGTYAGRCKARHTEIASAVAQARARQHHGQNAAQHAQANRYPASCRAGASAAFMLARGGPERVIVACGVAQRRECGVSAGQRLACTGQRVPPQPPRGRAWPSPSQPLGRVRTALSSAQHAAATFFQPSSRQMAAFRASWSWICASCWRTAPSRHARRRPSPSLSCSACVVGQQAGPPLEPRRGDHHVLVPGRQGSSCCPAPPAPPPGARGTPSRSLWLADRCGPADHG